MAAMHTFAHALFDSPIFRVRPTAPTVQRKAMAQVRLESMAFGHALVALVAKLVVIDGPPNKAEYQAFTSLFAQEGQRDASRLRSLFMKLVGDHSRALQYARQLASVTVGERALHEDLLEKLFLVATADAALNAAEMELLRAVAGSFGLEREYFEALVARHQVLQPSPYEVLGLPVTATMETVRAQHRAQVQMLHPDRHQAAGASPEVVARLSRQLAAVNAAYDEIKHSHSEKPAKLGARWWSRKNTKGAKP